MKKRKDTRPLAERKADCTSDYWMKKADGVWRGYVRKKFPVCVICGGSYDSLNSHHIIGCDNDLTRHHPLNGITLCPPHHIWDEKISAHGNPKEFKKFLLVNYPENYNFYLTNRFKTGYRDFEKAHNRLLELTDKL